MTNGDPAPDYISIDDNGAISFTNYASQTVNDDLRIVVTSNSAVTDDVIQTLDFTLVT